MPYGSNVPSSDKLLRTLIYGRPKTRKTTWACLCAEFGFNVVLLNGEEGGVVIDSMISEKGRSQILTVDLRMHVAKTVFSPFMAQLLRPGNVFLWDEQEQRACLGFPNPEHSYVKFDIGKLTSNDVVIVDGWKALSKSAWFKYAEDNELDLSDAKKEEWPEYSYCYNFLNWILARLHALPCHLIVVAHSQTYEVYDRRDKKNPKLIERRIQPISSSGRHSQELPGEFHDVFFFKRISPMAVTIDTGGDADRDGGSRLFEPRVYQFDDFLPDQLFNIRGLKSDPTRKCEGAVWYAPGAEVPTGIVSLSLVAENKVIEPPPAGSLLARIRGIGGSA